MIIQEILTAPSNDPREELDAILAKLCEMILEGQDSDSEFYGMVGACVVCPGGELVYGVNYEAEDGTRVHAERAALERCANVTPDCIIVTTLSPCNRPMDERSGESCEDLIADAGIEHVYCGYKDPTQDHDDSIETDNVKLKDLCKRLADTFLKESVDAISGAGARVPATPPKLKPQPPVKPVDPAVKIDIKKQSSDPYAQTYKKPVEEGQYDADPATYDLPRRRLNVPELIKRGAIFVVDTHGPNGWEPDAEGFSLVTLWNVANGGWPAEARQHLKPSMYKAAESGLNRQGPGSMVYDGKYNQILWSIKKLGIPDNVAFLDQNVTENFADGRVKGKSRPGRVKRAGASCKGSVTSLRAKAKRASGERARMYHWCANMKSGKKK